jgi:hypothetical protein
MTPRATSVLALLMLSACALNSRPLLSERQMAELWQEPEDLARRDLLNGPGGRRLAPDPNVAYTVVDVDDNGFSPGYEVRDPKGRRWNVKLGPEARSEVVVSRLVWAVGFYQPNVYYVPRWTLTAKGRQTAQEPARFRLEEEGMEDVGDWSWRDNPFIGTQPFEGLFVLMVMVNNWDLKTSQNTIYRVRGEGDNRRNLYVVKDLGASLGKTSWILPGNRDDLEDFEREPFISRVAANRVQFHYQGAWLEPHLAAGVTPDDVRWMSDLLARLRPEQWRDAFRAGGYSDAEAARYIKRLQEKIVEGQNID